jgi:hypothetical protein
VPEDRQTDDTALRDTTVTECTYRYNVDGTERACTRPATDGHDQCVFHLTPAERDDAGIDTAALREAFLADFDSDDTTRRTYVDVQLRALDLSELVVDGHDVGPLTFRNVSIDGSLDLSGSIFRHPVVVAESGIGRLDASDASFEMDVTVEDSTLGASSDRATCMRAKRAAFERSLRVRQTRFAGSVEFAASRFEGWLNVDGVTVEGRAHFPRVSARTMQFSATTLESGAEFTGADAETASFDGVSVPDGSRLDLSETRYSLLRVDPQGGLTCLLEAADVAAGRLAQPTDAVAHYDLTDATVGDLDLDCDPERFDRYRIYRTRFDGFPFASYRAILRSNGWRLHEYSGDPAVETETEGLERTYLEAKEGASGIGDSESASMFFLRELRYRRRRYADHATDSTQSTPHRVDAVLRWLMNGFFDVVAGYGERPQRTVSLSAAVILGSALTYPATAGLSTGSDVVRYATHGPSAALDGLYFSVVTFATLGLGDVHPAGDLGRFLAASEGLAGALLTAIFVFSLGRRVTR